MFKSDLTLIVRGFFIGSADVVPGVSGGTVALILGIYPQLINAIKSFDFVWIQSIFRLDLKGIIKRPHFHFLIPLSIGAVTAVLFFTRIVSLPTLIRTQPETIYSFFFGIILGSIILLFRSLGVSIRSTPLLFLLLGLFVGGFIILMAPVSTPDDSWFIFLCGAVVISAMILPGISGSYILLVMKKYTYIFNAVGYFDFSIIIPFVLGMITGVILFSRLLSSVLKYFYCQTIFFISGLLIASLYVIWPFQVRSYETIRDKERLISSVPYIPDLVNIQVFYSTVMILLGLVLVVFLDKISCKKTIIN